MAMLNNQRVCIYIYIISWYYQYVQRNLPLLASFFFLNCAPSHCTPESLPLDGTWRESKKLYGFVWWSLIQNMGFPHMFPMLFHVFCWKKSRLEMCKLPAPYHPHVGRSNEVFAPCPDPWELEPHPMVGSRKQHENMSCILGIRDIVEI